MSKSTAMVMPGSCLNLFGLLASIWEYHDIFKYFLFIFPLNFELNLHVFFFFLFFFLFEFLFMSQSTDMVKSGRCIILFYFYDIVTSKMSTEYNHPSKQY